MFSRDNLFLFKLAFAKNVKCGVKAPNCAYLDDNSPDQANLVQYDVSLICERSQKLIITPELLACCQSKNDVDTPEEADFITKVDQFTAIIDNLISNKDNLTDEDVAAQLQKIYDEFNAAANKAGFL